MKHDLNIVVGEPSLASLSYILRHKELWPKGFDWNYGSCTTCAMGLAQQLWSLSSPNREVMKIAMGISEWASIDIFLNQLVSFHPSQITPEIVADKIDGYLAGDMSQ